MKKAIKTIISLILVLTLTFCFTVGVGFAGIGDAAGSYSSYVMTNEEEVVNYVRSQMVERNNHFSVTMTRDLSDYYQISTGNDGRLDNYFFNEICKYTGNPKEGDYLRNNILFFSIQDIRIQGNEAVVDFYVAYYTEPLWEKEFDSMIKDVLSELDINGLSDYEKICKVHDYIVNNVSYDNEHYHDDSSSYYPKQYTAYAALKYKTAVCKGYAILFQRLMTELGIESYCINSVEIDHGWNIVKLEDKFYFVDTTWDDNDAGPPQKQYLLCGKADFVGHNNSDDEFSVSSFFQNLPISSLKYYPGNGDGDETVLPILGYAPKYSILSNSGKKVSTRATNGNSKVVIYGTSYCPFTLMMANEVKDKKIDGVDIIFCIDDTKIPSDFPELSYATYCKNKSELDSSIADVCLDFDIESGIFNSYSNSPSMFFINPKNQIVFAHHGYFEGFKEAMQAMLGRNAPSTGEGEEHTGKHTWKVKNYIKTPTESSEGTAEYICAECGKVQTRCVPRLDNTINGKCGDNATWKFDCMTGQLTIKGSGETWENTIHPDVKIGWVKDEGHRGNTPLDIYLAKDQIKSVVIEEGITSIGDMLLCECPNLKTIVIPKSVKTIGSRDYPYFYDSCEPDFIYYQGSASQWKKIKTYPAFNDIKRLIYNTKDCSVQLKTKTKNYTAKTLKKGKKTFTIVAGSAFGTLKYKSLSTKYVTVTSKGKVTVKKGTPKGTYKVKVYTSKTGKYAASSKILKVVVK